MYDLIIVGGGPAGLTATIYALRKQLNVLLITKNLGGKTNFRLQLPDIAHHLVINGEEIVNRFASEIEHLDFVRVMEEVERVQQAKRGFTVQLRGGDTHTTRALIIATGAHGRTLDVPGEREFMMRGLCYSAVSYAPLFLERDVVVIGDRMLALRGAAELARSARLVTLVAPSDGELDSALGRRLQSASNVMILCGYQVQSVLGDEYARSIVVSRTPNGEGSNGKAEEIHADAFFVELGLIPHSDIVKDLVKLDASDRIMVDGRCQSSMPGLFAAGDVTNSYEEQVLVSIGEGATAALSACEYLLTLPVEEPDVAEVWR